MGFLASDEMVGERAEDCCAGAVVGISISATGALGRGWELWSLLVGAIVNSVDVECGICRLTRWEVVESCWEELVGLRVGVLSVG